MQKGISVPKLDSARLQSAIVQELLTGENLLSTDLPGGGRGIILGDYRLLCSTGLTYKVIQGDWHECSPEAIPMPDYLRVLRKLEQKRLEFCTKRLSKLIEKVNRSRELIAACESQNVTKVAELLS